MSVPYPIPLVLGGLVLALVPGIREIEPDPDLVLVIFLPPLLYSAAFFRRDPTVSELLGGVPHHYARSRDPDS
jgi:hypothetical protein